MPEEMLGIIIAVLLSILYVLSPTDIPVDVSYCSFFQFLFRTIYAYSDRFVRGGEEEGKMKEWNGKYKKEKEREWNQSGEGRGEVGGEGQKVRGPMQGRQRELRQQLLPKKRRVICLPADHQPGSLPHP